VINARMNATVNGEAVVMATITATMKASATNHRT
jgi:hypothetical protein